MINFFIFISINICIYTASIKSSPFGKFLAYLNNSSELFGSKLFNNL